MEETTAQILLSLVQNTITSITVIVSTLVAYYILNKLREREKQVFIDFIKESEILRSILREIERIDSRTRILSLVIIIAYFIIYLFTASIFFNMPFIKDLRGRDAIFMLLQMAVVSIILYIHKVFVGDKKINLERKMLLNDVIKKSFLTIHWAFAFMFLAFYIYGVFYYMLHAFPLREEYIVATAASVTYFFATTLVLKNTLYYDELYFLEEAYKENPTKINIKIRLINGNTIAGKLLEMKDNIILKPFTDEDWTEIIPYSRIVSISLYKLKHSPLKNKEK